jgi:hypothetical protein
MLPGDGIVEIQRLAGGILPAICGSALHAQALHALAKLRI